MTVAEIDTTHTGERSSPGATFEVQLLNGLNGPTFARFTYAPFQRYLSGLGGALLGFGAFVGEEPAGLLLVEKPPADSSAHLVSICVAAEHRGRGIASALLKRAEKESILLGAETMRVTFPSGRPATPAILALLASHGWKSPQRKHWICTAGLRFRTAPWIDHYRLSSEFEVVPWADLTEADRAHLHAAEGDWIPPGLNPFKYEINLDPLCSIALRYHGQPVGWVLAQQRGEDTLVYASSFVRPDVRGRGSLIAAYAEACRRQTEHTSRDVGVWIVPMTFPPMAAFADRRMRPYLDSVEEFLMSEKAIRSSGDPTDTTHQQQEA